MNETLKTVIDTSAMMPAMARKPSGFPVDAAWIWLAPAALGLFAAAWLRLGGHDEAVFRAINDWGRAWPTFWSMLSVAGLGLSAFLLLGGWYAWVSTRGQPDATDPAAQALGALLICFPIGGVVTHGLKAWFATPRPPAVLPLESIHVVGQPLLHGSLPSGHSITALAVAGIVLACHRLGWRGVAAVLLLALGVVVSRITTAAHWPSDVCAGAAIGWLLAPCMAALLQRTALAAWLQHPRGRLLLALALLIAAASMPPTRTGYPLAEPLQWALAVVAAAAALWQLRDLWRHRRAARVAHG